MYFNSAYSSDKKQKIVKWMDEVEQTHTFGWNGRKTKVKFEDLKNKMKQI